MYKEDLLYLIAIVGMLLILWGRIFWGYLGSFVPIAKPMYLALAYVICCSSYNMEVYCYLHLSFFTENLLEPQIEWGWKIN